MSDEGDDRGTLEQRLCDARTAISSLYPPYPRGEGERKDLRQLLADAEDALGECRRALQVIEDWWLDGEMQRQFGAPAWMFLARAALAKLKGGD